MVHHFWLGLLFSVLESFPGKVVDHGSDTYCSNIACLQRRVHTGKSFFLFLNQNICCGSSKEPSHWDCSVEHPKHMFKLMGKEINAILGAQHILIWTYKFSASHKSCYFPSDSFHLDPHMATGIYHWFRN